MRLADLAAAAQVAAPPGAGAAVIGALTADSRAVTEGTLFAALPGAHADGRAFIAEAVARGAAAVLAPAGTAWPDSVPARPLLVDADPRRALARMAAAFAGAQPRCVVAVTGTNGKTSTVDFLRQVWAATGARAASLGTLGLIAPGMEPTASLTTPEPVALAAMLADLKRAGIDRVALEASSHGLAQRRLDGVGLAAAGFGNLTRDHLDYHGGLDAYRTAKLRLFGALLPAGAAAVAQAALEPAALAALRRIATLRGLRLLTVGEAGTAVRLLEARPLPGGQALRFAAFGAAPVELALPLVGRFQADNALLAVALAVVTGTDPAAAVGALPSLAGVPGRLERVAAEPAVYVDYAHTPDALARVLAALRPHATGRLVVVMGAGGDRDPGKRPLMGAAAAAGADQVFVTDDNPRSEDPAAIRAAIRTGCAHGIEIGDRRAAIAAAIEGLGTGDVLVVAGKGHETGQEVAGEILPFDDRAVIRALAGLGA